MKILLLKSKVVTLFLFTQFFTYFFTYNVFAQKPVVQNKKNISFKVIELKISSTFFGTKVSIPDSTVLMNQGWQISKAGETPNADNKPLYSMNKNNILVHQGFFEKNIGDSLSYSIEKNENNLFNVCLSLNIEDGLIQTISCQEVAAMTPFTVKLSSVENIRDEWVLNTTFSGMINH